MQGATTSQMLAAPRNAVYVWVNSNLSYPQRLARKLGREDLEIVSPAWIEQRRWAGRRFTEIILDHDI